MATSVLSPSSCPPAVGVGFSELMAVMSTLAGAGNGAGHLHLFGATIQWIDTWRIMLKLGACFMLVALAYIDYTDAGKTSLGNICTRTLAWNNECAGDNTCTTRVCGASRCWPKNHPRPMGVSRFCSSCWFLPWNCQAYWDMGVPQTLKNLPLGYICSDLVNNSECGTRGGKQLKCTSRLCGASRCWPEGEKRPDVGSRFCTSCWLTEINCPGYYSHGYYTKQV